MNRMFFSILMERFFFVHILSLNRTFLKKKKIQGKFATQATTFMFELKRKYD